MTTQVKRRGPLRLVPSEYALSAPALEWLRTEAPDPMPASLDDAAWAQAKERFGNEALAAAVEQAQQQELLLETRLGAQDFLTREVRAMDRLLEEREQFRLEVQLDAIREQTMLYRVALIFGVVGLFLVARQAGLLGMA